MRCVIGSAIYIDDSSLGISRGAMKLDLDKLGRLRILMRLASDCSWVSSFMSLGMSPFSYSTPSKSYLSKELLGSKPASYASRLPAVNLPRGSSSRSLLIYSP